MAITATPVPILSDNYAWLLHAADGGLAIVDPAEDAPVAAAIRAAGGDLRLILLTHHHQDHVAAVDDIRAAFPAARTVGAAADAHRLPGLDQAVAEGDGVAFGGETARVLDTPGHTVGHVAYHFPRSRILLAGDTLFALGCGKLLEGTPADMFASLRKFAALPPETLVCCGHEYTQSNARFALSLAPGDPALRARAAEIDALRAAGEPTLPVELGTEARTNPFLRASTVGQLAEYRAAKDVFR